jgi:hypothetical protein
MRRSSNRFHRSLAAGAGAALRFLDRASALLYLAGAFGMGGILVWQAFSKTPWLLLLAIPILVTASLLALAFHRNPDLGLRLERPSWRRRARPRKNEARHPSNKIR